LDAPIFHDGRVKGVICHEQVGSPRRWAPEERDFATAVADAIALKLESTLRQEAEAALQAQQTQLAEHQKMEALGRLAGGIAHDFKNLLHAILGHANLIGETAGISPEVREDARAICQVAQRGVELVRDLLDFGGTSRCATSIVNVTAVLSRMTVLLRATVGPLHNVAMRCADVGRVLIDPALFERVVLNLVVNARDALPDGGTIDIRLSGQGGDVVLEVRDNGVGMDAATQAHLFEPFFSTKPGKGTGLGLAIVKQIVERCGGTIRVDSAPGQGTTVCIHLPRAAASCAS
jgi:signal transduction histidine kinase